MRNPEIIIRPFQLTDKQALRQLCADVADRGDAVENIFFDRTMAQDMLTRYYTDYEPQSSFVAEANGRVVGYINGCLDNRRWGLVMFWIVLPSLVLKAFKRGIFFRREFWRMAHVSLFNCRRLFSWRKKEFNSHQGHMHIGVSQDFRHQHIGKKLIKAWCDFAKINGTCQLVASVHSSNKTACLFFEGQGFCLREQYDMRGIYQGEMLQYRSLFYVKDLI